jgi:hypothetical protein
LVSVTRLGLALLIAGVIGVLGTELRPSAPKPVRWSPLDSLEGSRNVDPRMRAVAMKFILTAVARRNQVASWDLLDPTFPHKTEFTRKTWAKGAIPVTPSAFPVRKAGIYLAVRRARPKFVLLEVLLTATRGKADLFWLGLRRHGRDAKPRWLVDLWMVKYEPPVGFK